MVAGWILREKGIEIRGGKKLASGVIFVLRSKVTVCVWVCVCVYVCNICLIKFISFPISSHITLSPSLSLPFYYPSYIMTPPLALLYTSKYPTHPHLNPPTMSVTPLLNTYGAISAITVASFSSGLCQICTSLSQGPRRSRMVDLTISSDITAFKMSHIYEYYCFSL